MPSARDNAFTTSDGCTIGYTQHSPPSADAPRIALIHSLALDRSFWNGVVAELSPHAELLTYDCRGHGRSARTASTYRRRYSPATSRSFSTTCNGRAR